jgi:cytochrome P450
MTINEDMAHPQVTLEEIDLSSHLNFWAREREFRDAAFKTLRDESPFQFFSERVMEGSPFPPGPGYRALTRHDDIWHVSRNPQLFCSGRGSNIGDLPQELNEFFGSMINMDDPKHFRLRSIVSKGFTPKEISGVEDRVRVRSANVVDKLLEEFPDGSCDFVEHVASPLPLQIICDMMGIPDSDVKQIFNWTNIILGVGDPEFVGTYDALLKCALEIFAYAQALGADRVENPRNDVTSVMMNTVVDGERLTAQEFGSFFILLVVAGNETTRNAISHGMKLLTDNPAQRKIWFDDFAGHSKTAVEEIVRLASPVIHFRRTATQDTQINGQPIKEGEKVVMWYYSGNRDERIFHDPNTFDITRALSPSQIGFGAGGPHFCLGANLARREITVMFDEIRRRMPLMRIVGEPAYLQSAFINGIKRMQCAWK